MELDCQESESSDFSTSCNFAAKDSRDIDACCYMRSAMVSTSFAPRGDNDNLVDTLHLQHCNRLQVLQNDGRTRSVALHSLLQVGKATDLPRAGPDIGASASCSATGNATRGLAGRWKVMECFVGTE